jgi:acyl-CoA synthetase (AMP-forming)/AMP-acid ligase II
VPATTIGALLAERARQHPDHPALVLPDVRLTCRDLDLAATGVARSLLALGLQAGDRVCVWLPNGPEWVGVELGAARIGVVVAPLNLRFKEADAAYVLGQLDPHLIVAATRVGPADHLDILSRIVPGLAALRHVVTVGEGSLPGSTTYAEFLAVGAARPEADVAAAAAQVGTDDVVHIQFTSGTTSRPKGAMLTHAAVLRNAAETTAAMAIGTDDPLFSAAPLYHVGAFIGGLLVGLHSGNPYVTMPRFEPAAAVELLVRERCTIFRGPQTILADVADRAEAVGADLGRLRGGICGSSTLSARLDLSRRLGLSDMVTIYGISEGATAVTMTRTTDPFPQRLEHVGRPLPGVDVRITDPSSGTVLPAGQIGEVCFRGWNVMVGYFRQPEETAKAFDADGFFHAGDLGWLDDDGALHFAGRLKDVIRVGGENVSAAEVEDWLDRHPQIHMAAVVSAPDERLGEHCVAFVRPVEGASLDPAALVDYCRDAMASFKVPRAVHVVTGFPLTGSGKVMKATLRDWLRAVPPGADPRPAELRPTPGGTAR